MSNSILLFYLFLAAGIANFVRIVTNFIGVIDSENKENRRESVYTILVCLFSLITIVIAAIVIFWPKG